MTTLDITSEAISSGVAPHYAWRVDETRWAVSWLPGRSLTPEDAINAMLIAELVWGTRTPATHIEQVGLRLPGVRTAVAVRLAAQMVLLPGLGMGVAA